MNRETFIKTGLSALAVAQLLTTTLLANTTNMNTLFSGLCYGPFRTGQTPNYQIFPQFMSNLKWSMYSGGSVWSNIHPASTSLHTKSESVT